MSKGKQTESKTLAGEAPLSLETLVIALCAVRTASDDEDAYMELLMKLQAYVCLSKEQEAFLEATMADFGITYLE